MPRNFNEKTTDRVIATADERSSAVIARTALRRVMTESNSLYTKPYLAKWVENKINLFKIDLKQKIEQEKNSTRKARDTHFPELYAKMLREELEYIELCIEYNDKVKTTVDEEGNFVEDDGPTKKPNNEGYITNVNNEPKIVGKIDLNNIGDEIE